MFKSHYDRFGRVAENKSKELSRASLSSDSMVSVVDLNMRGESSSNHGDRAAHLVHPLAMGRLGINKFGSNNEACNDIIEEEKAGEGSLVHNGSYDDSKGEKKGKQLINL